MPNLSGRVLVAEDGADNQRLLASFLRQSGVEFDMVGDGKSAVDRALAHEYALVFMDIQMPILDGVAATRLLRDSHYRGPIVALTANVMQDDVLTYRQAGCTEVLGKPIDRARFYDVLSKYVGEAQAIQESLATIQLVDYDAELESLTEEFVSGLPEKFAAIEQAARQSDRTLLKGLLHSLKGTAGSYGFSTLTQMAADMEANIATLAPEDLLDICRRMPEACGRPH